MSPYLRAFEHYHQDTDGDVYSWTDILDAHLQTGAVISTADSFVMARAVPSTATDAQCLDLSYYLDLSSPYTSPYNDWFVFIAAGDLSALLDLAQRHHIHTLIYQRHGEQRVRRVRTQALLKRASTISSLSSFHFFSSHRDISERAGQPTAAQQTSPS